jgi:hypothetical protein
MGEVPAKLTTLDPLDTEKARADIASYVGEMLDPEDERDEGRAQAAVEEDEVGGVATYFAHLDRDEE